VGNAVLTEFRNRNLAVNLTAPDVKIYIEIRGKRAYIFSEKHVGPGGFPLGTQGKAVALITDRKTVIASWLIMRRGCRVIPAYFEVDDRNVKSLINRLGVWDIRIKPYIIKSTEYQFDIEAYNKFGYSDEIYELASTIASRVRADVIISGETLDQLKNKVKAGYTCKYTGEYPIFYPLIGLDDDQMTIYAELIGV
jgi:thiamine biosynthesis protein ThiI